MFFNQCSKDHTCGNFCLQICICFPLDKVTQEYFYQLKLQLNGSFNIFILTILIHLVNSGLSQCQEYNLHRMRVLENQIIFTVVPQIRSFSTIIWNQEIEITIFKVNWFLKQIINLNWKETQGSCTQMTWKN